MAAPKIFHGARALVGIHDPQRNVTRVVGTFTNLNYHVTNDVQAAYILGSFIPAELVTTGVSPVSISASGWRTLGHGAYTDGRFPRVQDLLFQESIEIAVLDRQLIAQGAQDARIATIRYVKPSAYTVGLNERQLSKVESTYLGILVDEPDQAVSNAERADAAVLP